MIPGIEEKRQENQVPLFSKILLSETIRKTQDGKSCSLYLSSVVEFHLIGCMLLFITLKKPYLLSFAYFSKGYGARKSRLYSRMTSSLMAKRIDLVLLNLGTHLCEM